jgi:hypothetical protein
MDGRIHFLPATSFLLLTKAHIRQSYSACVCVLNMIKSSGRVIGDASCRLHYHQCNHAVGESRHSFVLTFSFTMFRMPHAGTEYRGVGVAATERA